MAETFPYPDAGTDAGKDTGVGPDRGATTGTSRWQQVVGILGIAVVLWVGSEMYDIVFFRGTGPGPAPGQDAPVEIQNPDGDPTPPGSIPHDPTQRDH